MTNVDAPEALADAMPFARACGIELRSASPEVVTGAMAWEADRCTVGGVLHGGAIATLADSVGAAVAHLNLPTGATTSTIDAAISFLRPVREGTVTAVSRPLHVGGSVVVVRTEVFDAEDRLVAHAVQHQAVRRPSAG